MTRAWDTGLGTPASNVLGYRGNSGHKQGWFCMGSASRLNAPPRVHACEQPFGKRTNTALPGLVSVSSRIFRSSGTDGHNLVSRGI